MADQAEKKKKKRPTALKRDIQNEKRRMRSKIFKSQVRTAMRQFEKVRAAGDKERVQEALNAIYSLMDKGTKKGVFKRNKAARTKARLSAKAHSKV